MDLDNEELLATRKLLGLDKTRIEKSIENLKEYIEEDELYILYKRGENKKLSYFDKFCIEHCEDIEVLITEYERQKQINQEHRKINGELSEKTKELEDKYILEKVAKEEVEELLESSIPILKIENEIKKLKTVSNNVFEKFKSTNKIDFKLHDKGIYYEGKISALETLLKEMEEK